MIGIMFIIFALFLALGIPIAFSVGWATLSVHLMNPAFTCDAEYFFKTMVNGMDSYVLLAIPLLCFHRVLWLKAVCRTVCSIFSLIFLGI